MAALPSPTQVAGSHEAIYEAYYNQVDPNGVGRIEAMDAARFLKKSNLSDVMLSKIWDMADPQSRGFLDKSGMFVALKLCAFAQAGRELNMANLSQDVAPPKMGDIPAVMKKTGPAVPTPPLITSVSNGDWSIKPSERVKYDCLFDSLQPSNGYIPGNKVKGVLINSKLPLDTLGKIWDLADIDKDGMLDRHEFVVAMHLVYKALEKHAIPSVLPPELMPPGKRKDSTPLIADTTELIKAPPIPPLPNASAINNLVGLQQPAKPPQPQQPPVQWVVSAEDQAAADKLFLQADMDMDGFVSGTEIKDVFLQSGLRQTVLADIWALCDLGQSGKLNKEQFALAMWLIKQKLRGIDPPAQLTPDMMPPSLRKFTDNTVVENNNISGYSNPELDMISKDIAELSRERRTMEQDIAQKEADIKIKNGEIKSLQSELDTLAATLKQLENQRGEAQKRLNDLKAQRADIEKELSDVERETREEQEKVDKLRQQAEEQESVLRQQEEELNTKRQELEGLRQEEQQLEQQQNKSRDQLNELTKNLQNTQLQISQAKAKITLLEEQQRQMTDAIAIYDSALAAGDPSLVPDSQLQFVAEIEELEFKEENKIKMNGLEDGEEAKVVDSFAGVNGSSDAFSGQNDPFSSNKAKDAFESGDADPFANFDGRTISSGFTSDPFAAKPKQDPFAPFDDNKRNEKPAEPAKDPFGDDPFANLHAPTRPESPSPALPPKKAKQPPPRPAPPRPSSGPTPMRAAPVPPTPSPTPDPFSNTNSDPFASQNDNNNSGFGNTGSGFADFANFDAKPDLVPTRSAPARPISRPRTTPTPKLPDFTEDPFRDYRYEDPFAIADPFADEDDLNANNKKSTTKKDNDGVRILDPFGLETTTPIQSSNFSFTDKDSFDKAFESDFSKTFPLIKGNINKSNNNNNNNTFNDVKSNPAGIKMNINEVDFENNSINQTTRPVNKPINFDEAFAPNKTEKTRHSDRNIAQVFKDMFTHDNSHKVKNNNGNATWNGRHETPKMLSEQEQLVWASQQSLHAEEERCRRKAQEDADFALAIELSKQENSGKF